MLGNMWYTLLHFSFPFFLPDKPYPFNQRHPFNCLLSLSRHFPLLLLCPFAPFFSLFLLILLLFYFCQHMVSQLSLSSLPSYLLSAFAFIFVLEIKLSDFPVQTHTCTLCHAPAEECASHLHSPSSLPSSLPSYIHSSSLIHLLLHAQPTIFTSLPPASVFISSSLSVLPSLHESFPVIFLQCVRLKTRITDIPNLMFVLVRNRSL